MSENDTPDVPEQPTAEDKDKTEKPPAGGNVEELPAWAREALSKANREAASYRTQVRDLEPLAKRAKDIEESQKTETEKTAERLAVAERTASESSLTALRLEVALDKGLSKVQAKRLLGSSKEELEADADELLASFAPSKDPSKTSRKPQERLRGGSDPDEEPEESDPRKLAAGIAPRRF